MGVLLAAVLSLGKENILIWMFFEKQGGIQILACHVYVHLNQLLLPLPAAWGVSRWFPLPCLCGVVLFSQI